MKQSYLTIQALALEANLFTKTPLLTCCHVRQEKQNSDGREYVVGESLGLGKAQET